MYAWATGNAVIEFISNSLREVADFPSNSAITKTSRDVPAAEINWAITKLPDLENCLLMAICTSNCTVIMARLPSCETSCN